MVLAVSVLAFVGLVVLGFAFEGQLAIVTALFPIRLALVLPPMIGRLTLAAVVGSVYAWRRRYRTRLARIHYTLVALLGVMFTWQLAAVGFLW